MFETFVERPVFNLLEFIYAALPGHDLGVSIIVFTILIRILMWPLVKRQLHQSKAMRKLAPELKKIKKAADGDRQKLARLQMELYKEHGIKPFATIGTLLVQIPIFIALFFSIRNLINDSSVLLSSAYEPIRDLGWIQTIAADMNKFEPTLLGIIDLSRIGVGGGSVYLPAILLAVVATVVQFYQSKMMLPDNKDAKKLSDIMRQAAEGKEADQSEVSAAISRSMLYFLPIVTFVFAIILPSALTLYLLTSAAVGYIQQARVFKQDEEEMEEISEEPTEEAPKKKSAKSKKPKKSSRSARQRAKKRRK